MNNTTKIEILQNKWMRWGTVSNLDGTPHFHRLPLIFSKWFSVYLHHFVGPDDARHPHDHPARFTTIGLWGSYKERLYKNGEYVGVRQSCAPWIRSFGAEHAHNIFDCNAWTLVIKGPVTRQWGFWLGRGRWQYCKDYELGE